MEKNIWLIDSNKSELITAQHCINEDGALKAISMLTHEAVLKMINRQIEEENVRPSLIILDYKTEEKENYKTLKKLQGLSAYAGVPVIFMVNKRTREIDEQCYEKGATVVVSKPFNNASIVRIERTAWQYEKSRNYEKILQKQANEINMAKQIKVLNEQLQKRNELLHQIFGRYFSNEVMDVILDNPGGASIGGEKRIVTVLMADLRGFTSISEELEADVVTDMINFFLGKMTEVIFKFGGSIIEFIGDAILAVFGAPVKQDDSLENAVASAILMQNAMKEVNDYNNCKGYPSIEMGIGINRGEVFIGNIGSDKMMRYNVMGSTVNTTSRIENYSVGGQILVSKELLVGMEDKFSIKNEFVMAAKGISQKISLVEIVGISGTYNFECDIEEDELINLDNSVNVYLHILQGKSILNQIYTGNAIAISRKRILVRLNNADNIELLSDVEIKCESNEFFSNGYAKVISKSGNDLILHFTYIDKKHI